jgi:hypothetical protein
LTKKAQRKLKKETPMRLRARDGEAVAFKKAPQNFWRIGAVRTHLQAQI